jgi:hypothetical protein
VDGQEYAQVGERLYSKYAVYRMQPIGLRYSARPQIFQPGGDYGRGVSPNYVEDVISRTKNVVQENGNILRDGGGLSVVASPRAGRDGAHEMTNADVVSDSGRSTRRILPVR